MTSILSFILKGGAINLILVFAYFISLIIVAERIIYFLWIRKKSTAFLDILFKKLASEPPSRDLLNHHDIQKFKRTPFFGLANQYLTYLDRPYKLMEEAVSIEGRQAINRMESSIWIIGLVGTLAPMLGLLGTMTGLIKSFQGIETLGGHVDISILAGGIWEAMLTTVTGLIVGILSLVAYRILDHFVEKKATEMSQFLSKLNVKFERSIIER